MDFATLMILGMGLPCVAFVLYLNRLERQEREDRASSKNLPRD
jgi:hypothetical protein